MGPMDDQDLLAALRRESDALAEAAAGHLSARIPVADDWTVADVVVHVGQGSEWVTGIVRDGLDGHTSLERLGAEPPPDPADEATLLRWFRAAADELHTSLAALDPQARGWTLGGPDEPLVGWCRRRAQETAVHRWDVGSAGARPDPIDRDLAVDGVDELFEVFVPRFGARVTGEGQTLHLHATDDGLAPGTGEWTATFTPGGLTWARGHAKGDAAVRGPASDLLLLLWGRVPPARLEVFGDAAVVDRWQSQVRI